jgi:hypothetical protein
MTRAETYRRKADEAERDAAIMSLTTHRDRSLAMAAQYRQLADEAEKRQRSEHGGPPGAQPH